MAGASIAQSAPGSGRSFWSRLKAPAVVLLILLNVLYFGGNAAYDLWQTLSPGQGFSGTITGHERLVTKGENSQQLLLITVETSRGRLQFDVPEHTFTDTSVGQQVTGEIDSHGGFGHDEALRSLTADGKRVFHSLRTNRVINQGFILLVVTGVSALAISWIVGGRRRAARARVAEQLGTAAPPASGAVAEEVL